MSRRQPSSSRYAAAAAAAKRAKTEQMKPETPTSQRSTAKMAAPAAPEAPPQPAPQAPQPASQRIQAPPPKQAAPPPKQAASQPAAPQPKVQQQQKAASSSRVPAPAQKTPPSERLQAQPKKESGKGASSARLPAHGSARQAVAKGSSARAGAASSRQQPGSSRRGAAKGNAKPNKLVLAIAAGVVVLGLVAAISYKPIAESMKLKAIDASKSDPTKLDASLKAADEFVKMVDGDPARLQQVVVEGHGAVEVQIHLAQVAGLMPQLVSIAERDSLTPAQRAAALKALAEIYDRDKHANERLPNGLGDWCADAKTPDEVAAAALTLVARADREDAVPTLVRVVANQELTGERVAAALDGLAQLVDGANCGEALSLFAGPARARALGHAGLKEAIAKASGSQVDKLVELGFSDDHQVKVFALGCLGDHGSLPDTPTNDSRREKLAARFAPVLKKGTDPDELAGAIKAVKRLALTQDADPLLDLASDLNVLALPGVGPETVSEALGKDFMINGSDAAKAQADEVVKKLGAAVADPHKRAVAAGALKLVARSDIPSVRPALDQLAAVGDKDCVEALKSLVGKAYAREDIVKANGDSAEAWRKWLTTEHAQSQRVAEIQKWLADNGKFMRVTDGRERLQASADFIDQAKTDMKPWLEPSWVPPLSITRANVADLQKTLKFTGNQVHDALAGAKQDAAKPTAPAAGGDNDP